MKILHCKQLGSGEVRKLGPYQIESLISPVAEEAFTAYRVCVESGQKTGESYHKVAEECYYVIEGSGLAVLDDQEHLLETGDFLRLPPGTRHRFETGADPLVMLNLHCPGSRPDRDVYFTDEAPEEFTDLG